MSETPITLDEFAEKFRRDNPDATGWEELAHAWARYDGPKVPPKDQVRHDTMTPMPPMEPATLHHAEDSLVSTEEIVSGLAKALPAEVGEPGEDGLLHRVLHCSSCKKVHVDDKEWAVRNHKTHRCVDGVDGPGCGKEWESERPCVGVRPPLELIPVDVETLARAHISEPLRHFYRRMYPSTRLQVVQPVDSGFGPDMTTKMDPGAPLDRLALGYYLRDCERWGFIPERPHFGMLFGDASFDPSRVGPTLREQAYMMRVKLAVFFSKLVQVAPDQQLPLEYVEKTMRTLRRLYDNDMIVAGMLCQVCRINLGRPCRVTPGGKIVYDDDDDDDDDWKPQAAIFFSTFTDPPSGKDETAHGRLNAFLRNQAFRGDGEVGDSDWTNL